MIQFDDPVFRWVETTKQMSFGCYKKYRELEDEGIGYLFY